MGAGTARMNIYNIRKATTALSLYLKSVHPSKEIKVTVLVTLETAQENLQSFS